MKAKPRRRHRRFRSGTPPPPFQTASLIGLFSFFSSILLLKAGNHTPQESYGLTLRLPGGPSEEIDVHITREGQVLLNGGLQDTAESKDLPQLTENLERLRQLAEASDATLVIELTMDPLARYERVMDVLGASVHARIPI